MKKILLIIMVLIAYRMNSQNFWEQLNTPNNCSGRLAVNSNGQLFGGFCSMGVFRSDDDGDSWFPVNNGLTLSSVYSIDINPTNDDIYVSASNYPDDSTAFFRSSDYGENWTLIESLINTNYRIATINQYGHVYLNNNDGDILCSTDNGNNWDTVNWSINVRDLVFNYSGHIFATWGDSIFRSIDNGKNWFPIMNGLPPGFFFGKPAFNSSGDVFLPLYEPSEVGMFGAVCRSTDNGDTWLIVYPISLGTIGIVAINSEDHIYAASSFVIRSLNNGTTWENVSSGLPSNPGYFIGQLVINPNDRIFAHSYFMYRTTIIVPVELINFNSSVTGNTIQLTWQTASEINNQGFEIYRNGNKIAFVVGKGTTTETQDYSFTDKNLQAGIYNYRLNQLDFDGTQEVVGELTVNLTLPEEFTLEQNYPNPFNPSTTIKFSIPASLNPSKGGTLVTLKVYDVLGIEVAALVNEEKPAGSYEVEFNVGTSRDLSLTSGIYFYKLQAGSFVEMKKMVLMK